MCIKWIEHRSLVKGVKTLLLNNLRQCGIMIEDDDEVSDEFVNNIYKSEIEQRDCDLEFENLRPDFNEDTDNDPDNDGIGWE